MEKKLPQYFDSGNGQPSECLGQWLDINLVPGIISFRGQFGYFEISALSPYRQVLSDAAQNGGNVRFVLGANDGNLSADDVRGVLDLVEGTANGSLVVVRYDNALFHPKTLHLVRQDGSEAAVVGSANFTGRGLGRNVEAMVTLDTRNADDRLAISAVADAIDRWNGVNLDGVFAVQSEQDVQRLIADGVIDVPQIRRPSTSIKTRRSKRSTLGKRSRMWTPPAALRHVTLRPAPSRSSPVSPRPALNRPATNNAVPSTTALFTRWCKQLSKSDAQQVTQATNPTGKLRLSKAGFDIDLTSAFRSGLFRAANWQPLTRNGKTYEAAEIDFDVEVRGNWFGTLRLTVDHAAHRVAGQNNVPTVLAWGTRLNQALRGANYVGDWVVIEQTAGNGFLLTIQSAKPSWSP